MTPIECTNWKVEEEEEKDDVLPDEIPPPSVACQPRYQARQRPWEYSPRGALSTGGSPGEGGDDPRCPQGAEGGGQHATRWKPVEAAGGEARMSAGGGAAQPLMGRGGREESFTPSLAFLEAAIGRAAAREAVTAGGGGVVVAETMRSDQGQKDVRRVNRKEGGGRHVMSAGGKGGGKEGGRELEVVTKARSANSGGRGVMFEIEAPKGGVRLTAFGTCSNLVRGGAKEKVYRVWVCKGRVWVLAAEGGAVIPACEGEYGELPFSEEGVIVEGRGGRVGVCIECPESGDNARAGGPSQRLGQTEDCLVGVASQCLPWVHRRAARIYSPVFSVL